MWMLITGFNLKTSITTRPTKYFWHFLYFYFLRNFYNLIWKGSKAWLIAELIIILNINSLFKFYEIDKTLDDDDYYCYYYYNISN